MVPPPTHAIIEFLGEIIRGQVTVTNCNLIATKALKKVKGR
ncbi:MAG: hypothetical protein NT070_14230 [Cyanobacteria bacterium]|nr:hypothetical protein [Cyanobacteriota bacterium]